MGPARDEILSVKNGKVELKELLAMCEKYEKLCDKAFEETKLRSNPDYNALNEYLIKVMKKKRLDYLPSLFHLYPESKKPSLNASLHLHLYFISLYF